MVLGFSYPVISTIGQNATCWTDLFGINATESQFLIEFAEWMERQFQYRIRKGKRKRTFRLPRNALGMLPV